MRVISLDTSSDSLTIDPWFLEYHPLHDSHLNVGDVNDTDLDGMHISVTGSSRATRQLSTTSLVDLQQHRHSVKKTVVQVSVKTKVDRNNKGVKREVREQKLDVKQSKNTETSVKKPRVSCSSRKIVKNTQDEENDVTLLLKMHNQKMHKATTKTTYGRGQYSSIYIFRCYQLSSKLS